MKSGRLIECNMRKVFLKELYTTYGGEASSTPFCKKQELIISLDQGPELL